jgi:hypothetical protein
MSIIVNGQTQQSHEQIVTAGLAIALDAADHRCYVSGSPVLYNLSPTSSRYSTSAVLTPSASWITPSTGGAGSIAFSGSYAYWEYYFQTPSGSVAPVNQPYTLFCWASGSQFSLSVGGGKPSEQIGKLYYSPTNNYTPYFQLTSPTSNTTVTSPFSVNATVWNQIGVSWSGNVSKLIKLYINGAMVSSGTTSTNTFYSPIQGLTTLGAFTFGNSLYYNRVLTDAEVLQNYNAQKARFGL